MRVPKYRKHSSGRAFVEWNHRRWYFPGLYGSSESHAAYRRFLREQLFADGPTIRKMFPNAKVTVGELVLEYLKWAETYYPDSLDSEYVNMKNASLPLVKEFCDVNVESFGPLRLKHLQKVLIEQGKARTTINATILRMRRIFRWGVSEELVPPFVLDALEAVQGLQKGRTEAVEPTPRLPVPRSSIDAVLPHLQPQVRTMVELQWLTGVRSESLCFATPSQFDMTSDEELWYWRPKHKTEYRGHELIVPLGRKCQNLLDPYMDRDEDAYLFNPREGKQGTNKRYNKHYTRYSYRQAIVRAVDKHNEEAEREVDKIQRFTPHQIRHAKGDEVREAYGVEAAQATLGHRSIDATQIYAKKSLELAKKVARETG